MQLCLYGSKASNGVILITTKRGKTGKARISYNGYVGIQRPTETIDRLSSYDYARLFNQSLVAEGLNPRFSDDDLKKGDLKICCLLKAGFSQKEIMELLDLKEDAMNKRMQRLKSRLSLKKKWSKNELEQYISSF